MPSRRWFIISILLGLCAGLLAACAAPPPSATPTYTLTTGTPVAPTATRTALPSATATLPLRTVTATRQPATPSPFPPTPAWTPPTYTPPTAGPLALSPANARHIAELAVLGNGRPADVAWSPDGALLAVAAMDWVDLYNTSTWQRAAHYALPAEHVVFSPAGAYLIAVGGGSARWLDLATGVVTAQRPIAPQRLRQIRLSPGGTWLAVLGADCGICGDPDYALEVLNAVTGATMFVRRGYNYWQDIAFSPDGRTLALGDSYGLVLLDADTGAELAKFELEGAGLVFTADGAGLLRVVGQGLRQLDLATGAWGEVPNAPLSDGGLQPSPDGRRWAILQQDPVLIDCACRDLIVWQVDTQQALASVWVQTGIERVALSPDGGWVAWADENNYVGVMSVSAPDQPISLAYTQAQWSVAFGPGTDQVLSGDWDGARYTWSRATGRLLDFTHPISDSSGRNYYAATLGTIESLAYSPADQLLVTSYHVGEVRVTDLATGQLYANLTCQPPDVAPIRVGLDGGFFTGVCGPNREEGFGAWDLRTGALLASYARRFQDLLIAPGQAYGARIGFEAIALEPLGGGAPLSLPLPSGAECVGRLTLSADGRWLAAGSCLGDVYVWDLKAPSSPQILFGHLPLGGDGYRAGVNALAFSPTSSLLASAGADGTVRLWDPALGLELRRFAVGLGEVKALAFDAGGAQLAAASEDGLVRVWGLPNND